MALFPAASGGADPALTALGWWTRQPVGASAPQGGFALGYAPDGGALHVAALRITIDRRPIEAVLTLHESGGHGADLAAIVACASGNSWKPAAGAPMSEAPPIDCDQATDPFTRTDDGTWTGNLLPLLQDTGGEVSVALVPQPATSSPLGGATAYSIEFNPPEFVARAPATTSTSRVTTSTKATTTTSASTTTAAASSGTSATTRAATATSTPAAATPSLPPTTTASSAPPTRIPPFAPTA